jgi:hypothetical protein
MLLAILLFSFGNRNYAFAQKKPSAPKFGFYFKGKYQKTAKIPFDLYANLIVIKVKIIYTHRSYFER